MSDFKETLRIHKELCEAVGDNKIDNLVADLKRVTEVELSMFVSRLLQMCVKEFAFSYSTPQFEEFKEAFKDVLSRHLIMDGEEKGDLYTKIEAMFKDIFVQNYAGLGPEAASLSAQLYAEQMVQILKQISVQANAELFPKKSWY